MPDKPTLPTAARMSSCATVRIETTAALPESFSRFLNESCGLQVEQLRTCLGADLPQPARQLLVHGRDMTSTLAQFHDSALRVDVLQQRSVDDHYLREVFLRTCSADQIVEYGVIAIALEHFTPTQRTAIHAGQIPLGALLHQFAIPFQSSPIGFFSVGRDACANVHRSALNGSSCYGRFNQLTRPTGEPLAWIMEILPPL